jgi:hypothetical protein
LSFNRDYPVIEVQSFLLIPKTDLYVNTLAKVRVAGATASARGLQVSGGRKPLFKITIKDDSDTDTYEFMKNR